jgi:uncharacterized damage-inducible protein DinB
MLNLKTEGYDPLRAPLLRGWGDSTLQETSTVDGEEISRAWMLYHLLEHFAHHRGQIALLDSLRKASVGLGGREGSAP